MRHSAAVLYQLTLSERCERHGDTAQSRATRRHGAVVLYQLPASERRERHSDMIHPDDKTKGLAGWGESYNQKTFNHIAWSHFGQIMYASYELRV